MSAKMFPLLSFEDGYVVLQVTSWTVTNFINTAFTKAILARSSMAYIFVEKNMYCVVN